jgi:hypothetical protein
MSHAARTIFTYNMLCDRGACEAQGPEGRSIVEARDLAIAAGWVERTVETGSLSLCPDHVATTAMPHLADPPEVTE